MEHGCFQNASRMLSFTLPTNGTEPPDVEGKRVFIVDFSYDRETMIRVCKSAAHVTILDHHKSARDALNGLADTVYHDVKFPPLVTFDMEKSGGRLAWEYLCSRGLLPEMFDGCRIDNPPWLVRHTEDRDLWRWALPNSRPINAYIRSFPLTFEQWDEFFHSGPAISEGEAILRREAQIVDDHIRHAREIELCGHKILAVNATTLFSDIAGKLAEGRPFGAAYFDRGDGKRQWSLRSRNEGVDVSKIAKQMGGGGHRNAAGFEETL